MKKFLALAIAFGILTQCSVSAAVIAPSKPAPSKVMAPLKASDVRIPIGNTGKTVSLLELSTMKVDDLEHLTGQKMGWFKRMEFKLALKKIKNSIKPDGTVDSKKLARLRGGYYDDDGSFHFGGFALGFFVGLVGVLIAYLIQDDNHHRRVKWAWIGFGTFVVLYVILIIAALSSAGA
ncbi:MAG TPA: hypothetical protein VFE32_13600 [Puia sp.]|jgi:hypothetical protein|nr:hypothetical protein [Puia sp.]